MDQIQKERIKSKESLTGREGLRIISDKLALREIGFLQNCQSGEVNSKR
jgi:hypothetical protein